jgi:RNA polymerase sigma-70 factor (ECF subfamily)
MLSEGPQITALLKAWSNGERAALDQLTPLVYNELRRVARRKMRMERAGVTLQTTALVNEVYLRMVDATGIRWQDRAHFFAISASMMRRILLDAARASAKRGGKEIRVALADDMVTSEKHEQLIALDDALETLAKLDSRKSRVIELRYFGGLSVEETAEVLKLSPQSVMRDWKLAKAWLTRELSGQGNES